MELRVLRYFLVTVQEGSITGAANALHLSQPTLSKQLRELEEEFGKQLLIRGSRKVSMTEEGMLLWRRAEEIFKLVDRTKMEIQSIDEATPLGDVVIGSGESQAIHLLTTAMRQTQMHYPGIHFQLITGDTKDVLAGIEDSTMDFGIIFESPDRSRYECVELPLKDRWGILMRKDDKLADRESINLQEIVSEPLIMSRQFIQSGQAAEWFGNEWNKLRIVGNCSLIFNASLMVEDNLGYCIALDGILNLTGDSHLCFKPLYPLREVKLNLIWKKYTDMSRQARLYMRELKDVLDRETARQQIRNES